MGPHRSNERILSISLEDARVLFLGQEVSVMVNYQEIKGTIRAFIIRDGLILVLLDGKGTHRPEDLVILN